MLLILVLCVIRAAAPSPDVHTVLPESYDAKPVDGDEYGVRNHVSDHEIPKDVPTRVKIVGDLGTPPPGVKLDFVPKQTYVQVRRYDAVKRLPQDAAMEEAATSEEAANAPRLREVVTHKKTQEVYEEQGYEDAGYDHGGSKKLKIEEEVKDNQSTELLFGPKNSSTQNFEETKDDVTVVAPSGRGTWSRHKTTTGKKTKYEEDDDKRKITTYDNNPTSETSSGNFTKFNGGKTIIVQNLTETEKRDAKNEGAESRRVASISKTRENVEPTTYRPMTRFDSSRQTTKHNINEPRRNRTRSRPRKRQESDARKPQTDVIGSYDNSPWIPIPPPTDYKNPVRERTEGKKQIKLKTNAQLHEPIVHATRFRYIVNHDMPYQYVIPTDIIRPETLNKPIRKLRPKPKNSDVTVGKPIGSSFANYNYPPLTNYDGSAINQNKKKVKKSSEEDLSYDNRNLHLNNKYKEPMTQLKTNFSHNTNQHGSAINQRQKPKVVQVESSEHFSTNIKPELHRDQKNKEHRDIETDLENHGDSGSRYSGTIAQDFGPPKNYNAPFITRLKKNNFNHDTRGEPILRIYPKYEIQQDFQNLKHSVIDETHREQKPLSNINKGHANFEFNENPPRIRKHESTRLSGYSKFNNRPKNNYKQSAESSESWENYPKNKDQSAQLSENKYSKINIGEEYPKFEQNKRFESTGTKSSAIYRLIPYEKSVKINNPYSYVYHDDHYPSGSRYSGVKVEGTTQSSKLKNRELYWNNRHPHLPKDSIKNASGVHRAQDKSEDENTRHVENLTIAHYSGLYKSGSYRPLPLEYNERVNNLAKLLNDNYPKRIRRDLEVINIASSGTTTEIPVDTVVYPHYKNAPKQSALRYATNPILTPRKTAGGMEFYASTNKVQCTDDIAPSNIVPERTEDGEWKGEPSSYDPRIDALGDKIGCFKTKYFGSDPLDNPIFKEKDVGFPDVLFTMKKPLEKKESIQEGKQLLDGKFADELIPGNWFPIQDKRRRRSHNTSLPNNHKVQGLATIIPEPVILTFPNKSSLVVYINDTTQGTEVDDSEGSPNDEHVLQYSVQHPPPEPYIRNNHPVDSKILGLLPPPQTITIKKINNKNVKKKVLKKLLKKVKVDVESNEADLLDVFSPITSFFTDEDDVIAAPIVHNFFNIKMSPTAKLKTTTTVDKNSGERVNRFQVQNNYRRTKRNMKGVDLQKPKQRKLNIDVNTNLTLSTPTARVRMYSPENSTWFRSKRDHVSVNVDVRRKEPRYYYHTERPHVRVKRVVHNTQLYSRSSPVFSSKYLVADQDNSETLPEEVNIAFSTTPKYETTPKFIPAIAFGDSKTKIIKYNDSMANSTNDIVNAQFDKKGSLIYVINPDTGHGKWMQVIKVKNEEDTKTALMNGPVYLEKKVKDGLAEETIGKFGFKGTTTDLFRSALGPTKDLFRNTLGPVSDHRFKVKLPNKDSTKVEEKKQSKKADCPNVTMPKKKEVRRRTTTTTTTEIPVVEEVDDRPEESSGEEENPGNQEDVDEDGNEEEPPQDEQPVERPPYQQESEENPDDAEDQEQDVHETKQRKPYAVVKKPEFSGYFFGSRDKNKKEV